MCLQLKMKQKHIIMNKHLFIYLLLTSCTSCNLFKIKQKEEREKTIVAEKKMDAYFSNYKYDSIVIFGDVKYNGETVIPSSEIKKRFRIKQGKLYDSFQEKYVSNLTIQLRKNNFNAEDVYINNGLPEGTYYEIYKNNMDWRLFNYDKKGNLNGVFVVANYEVKFTNGNGYWKDYYYIEETNEYPIKEEGKIKNNFKFGEWKYYNKQGTLDSLKTYTLNDSVDVRFPHCLFNKNEPCY